jgi:hypothetical protein
LDRELEIIELDINKNKNKNESNIILENIIEKSSNKVLNNSHKNNDQQSLIGNKRLREELSEMLEDINK